jgi:hypothetical protein
MGGTIEPQTDAEIISMFAPLFQRFEKSFAPANRAPLLAH